MCFIAHITYLNCTVIFMLLYFVVLGDWRINMNAKELCTCKNTKCKLHPQNHDMGCTPCIEKNLKMDEMPNCFFDKIDPEHKRKGTKTKDYAEFLLKGEA